MTKHTPGLPLQRQGPSEEALLWSFSSLLPFPTSPLFSCPSGSDWPGVCSQPRTLCVATGPSALAGAARHRSARLHALLLLSLPPPPQSFFPFKVKGF